jgi:hypothetical protein
MTNIYILVIKFEILNISNVRLVCKYTAIVGVGLRIDVGPDERSHGNGIPESRSWVQSD